MVAEGVRTTGAALALGARHGVELPLAAQMAAVLDGTDDARASAVEMLMLRPQRSESDQRTEAMGFFDKIKASLDPDEGAVRRAV